MQYWLYKTEPSTFSFSELEKKKSTNWDQIRNYQARNYLKQAKKGDLVIVYHSGDDKAAAGVARIVREAYPDIDPEDPKTEWFQVDIEFVERFSSPIALSQIKSDKQLATMPLVKQSRLSAMPILPEHYKLLCELGRKKSSFSKKPEKPYATR